MPHPTRRVLLATAALAPALMTAQQAQAQGVTPKRGGTLTSLLTPEPAILIPGVNSQAPALIVQSKMYQSLLEFSPTLEPKAVATSISSGCASPGAAGVASAGETNSAPASALK